MTATNIDVEAINLGRRQALLNTGEVVAIDVLIDDEGEETQDPAAALSFVLLFPNGLWATGAVSSFQGTRH